MGASGNSETSPSGPKVSDIRSMNMPFQPPVSWDWLTAICSVMIDSASVTITKYEPRTPPPQPPLRQKPHPHDRERKHDGRGEGLARGKRDDRPPPADEERAD